MSTPPLAQSIPGLVDLTYQRISPNILRTPLVHDTQYHLFLKCENLQHTGSFKLRGALSKLSTIPSGQKVVTASTGNHGLGVAKAASIYDLPVKVFIPPTTSSQKKKKLLEQNIDLVEVEGDSLQAELAGKKYAQDHDQIWVSPYNDEQVIAGQGTIAVELLEQINLIDRIYVTVGGGGLISGIAGKLNAISPDTEIIGCHPLLSPEMYLSTLAGHVVDLPESRPTLSDGSAGPLEHDSITFALCQQWIDRFILVSEEEIEKAIHYVYHQHQLMVEGAAGVAFAAALKDEQRKANEHSVVVLCGGNIDADLHLRIVNERGD